MMVFMESTNPPGVSISNIMRSRPASDAVPISRARYSADGGVTGPSRLKITPSRLEFCAVAENPRRIAPATSKATNKIKRCVDADWREISPIYAPSRIPPLKIGNLSRESINSTQLLTDDPYCPHPPFHAKSAKWVNLCASCCPVPPPYRAFWLLVFLQAPWRRILNG